MKKIRAGIIGGAGYTGGELIRLLLLHPAVEIVFVQSSSHGGKPLHTIHTDLAGETELDFSTSHGPHADVLFLCGGHDVARKFITENNLPAGLVLIDLSQDFRRAGKNEINERSFVYGLPELQRSEIKKAKNIANPGCFATCIQLALLPLADAQQINSPVHINAITGSTGAGQALSNTTHFSWRDSNVSVYKAFEHQHIKEIEQSLVLLQPGYKGELLFVPQRGNFARGILASAYLESDLSLAQLIQLYRKYYDTHPFVTICENEVDIKQVVNTNRCFIHLAKHRGYALITSVIDNLLKGASGQAVQNMNLIFGLDEKSGLQLKPSAF